MITGAQPSEDDLQREPAGDHHTGDQQTGDREGARWLPGGPATLRAALYHWGKRTFDVVAVLVAVPVVVPLFLLCGAAIRLESPGPVIFRQRRVGARRVRHGDDWRWEVRPFTFYKLRSMTVSADTTPHQSYIAAYIAGDEEAMRRLQPERDEGNYKMARDPRVTRVGAILRSLSLDELPQLWNVLKGDMSLVGPRPPIDYETEHYTDADLRRLAGLPGVTGWWQVRGRCECSFEEMVDLDVEYLSKQSLAFDLKILMMTIPVVASRRGAG